MYIYIYTYRLLPSILFKETVFFPAGSCEVLRIVQTSNICSPLGPSVSNSYPASKSITKVGGEECLHQRLQQMDRVLSGLLAAFQRALEVLVLMTQQKSRPVMGGDMLVVLRF